MKQKIYLAHSSKLDYRKSFYEPIKNSLIDKMFNVIYYCEDDDYKSKSSEELIKQSDLIIADVSLPSTGMGIELGIAYMLKKKIIIIYKNGLSVPFYTRNIANFIIEYGNADDMVKKLVGQLCVDVF